MSNEAANTEPWLAYLNKKWLHYDEGMVEHDLALILKDMLLSSDDGAAPTAAHQINTYYWDRITETRALFKFQNKDGLYDFLNLLYHMIIDSALQLPYHDSRQDTLVQLLVELRELPPGPPAKAWNGDCLVTSGEPMLIEMLEETWGGVSVYEERERAAPPSEWKKECEEWVNFSSFLARCVNARVDDYAPDIARYPRIEIQDGLENNIPLVSLRETKIMVAAQYILLAGRVFDEETVQKPILEKGSSKMLDKWPLWVGKLKEQAETELPPEVKTAVVEAQKKLISLHPELFPISEGGSKPDP